MVPMEKVLFLCTGNSARSQMAEAFLRKYGNERFESFSAGTDPRGVNPLTVQVMAEAGIDISGQRSKGVEEYLGKTLFDYLITVCERAEKNCPTPWPGVWQHLHWRFEDPAACEGTNEERIAKFRQVRDLIDARIREWVK